MDTIKTSLKYIFSLVVVAKTVHVCVFLRIQIHFATSKASTFSLCALTKQIYHHARFSSFCISVHSVHNKKTGIYVTWLLQEVVTLRRGFIGFPHFMLNFLIIYLNRSWKLGFCSHYKNYIIYFFIIILWNIMSIRVAFLINTRRLYRYCYKYNQYID